MCLLIWLSFRYGLKFLTRSPGSWGGDILKAHAAAVSLNPLSCTFSKYTDKNISTSTQGYLPSTTLTIDAASRVDEFYVFQTFSRHNTSIKRNGSLLVPVYSPQSSLKTVIEYVVFSTYLIDFLLSSSNLCSSIFLQALAILGVYRRHPLSVGEFHFTVLHWH